MQADGHIIIDTAINTDGIEQGTSEIQSILSNLGGTVKKIGLLVAAAFGVKKLIDFGKEATQLGSDLSEVQNVVDVTFSSMSGKVDEFARNAIHSAGLSETMAKRYVGTFGAMSKSFGFTEAEAYDMSTALTQLTGDVASFYNLSQELSYTKLKSVFTGETESLKDLGIVMTQAALDAYALENGFGKTTAAMTEQEKVALRLKFVQEQLTLASGDFVRTSDGWANQVRVMQLQISSLKATIGQGLINIFSPALKAINVVLARLATVANAFKALTELLTGGRAQASGNTGVVNDMSATADGYGAAAESADKYAEAAEGAGAAAEKSGKEAKGALASFDKLNVSADQSGSGGGGSGGGGGALSQVQDVDYGKLAEGEKETDKMSTALEVLINRFRELKGLFDDGFKMGVGDLSVLDSIRSGMEDIRDGLLDIFTDGAVVTAANNMLDTLAYDMGRVAGSFASIGLSVADAIVGGFAKYVSQSRERIKSFLVSVFDITGSVSTIAADFSVAVADIFSVFRGDVAKQAIADIISIFSNAFMGSVQLAGKLFRDFVNVILNIFTENSGEIKKALENFLSPASEVLDTLSDAVEETFDNLNQMYDEHLAPLFTSIKDGFSRILWSILEGYNQHMAPALDRLAKKVTEVWKEHVQPAIDKAIEVVGKVGDVVMAFWEEILQPLIDWIVTNIYPVVAPIIQELGTAFIVAFGSMADTVTKLLKVLSGILDFITKVFRGDWEGAWNDIKSVFDGVMNLLPNSVKSAVDKILGFINSVIDSVKEALNWFKRLDEDGSKTKSLTLNVAKTITGKASIPKRGTHLPRLASGTVVPPRAGEFAAILGDNRRETEVVSPLSTMRQAMLEAMQQAGGMGGGDINLTVYLDGRQIYQTIVRRNRMETDRSGINPMMG